jgi:hypothetical protein
MKRDEIDTMIRRLVDRGLPVEEIVETVGPRLRATKDAAIRELASMAEGIFFPVVDDSRDEARDEEVRLSCAKAALKVIVFLCTPSSTRERERRAGG